jgi:hypothetical protein
MRILPSSTVPSYKLAYHRMRHPSLGTPAAERIIPGIPPARTQTIEFAPYPRPSHRTSRDKSPNELPTSDDNTSHLATEAFATERDTRTLITALTLGFTEQRTEPVASHPVSPLYRPETMRTFRSTVHRETHASFGGFPGLREIISKVLRRFLPGVHQKFRRSITIPRTTTITSMRGNTERARAVPYVSFDAVVGHNSSFISLTEEQLEELGGVEFRALNALLWIVGIVC